MIDLHCHSTASDGTLTPVGIVSLARTIGLAALALTDHDTTGGLADFLAAGSAAPELECIPGIEFSCHLESGDTCHIVGLYIDLQCERLQESCRKYCLWREERNERLIGKLDELGFKLTMDDVRAVKIDGEPVIGRPHFAQALIQKGYFSERREVFSRLLGRGRPAYVAREVLTARDCLETIHAAGGLAIWAHPMTSSTMTCAKCERHVEEMKAFGLDGIEAYYTEHTPQQIENVNAIARKHGLLVSGGSDFHGANQPGIHLGTGRGTLRVPDELLIPMRERLKTPPLVPKD